jgi:hypothetical protein
LRCTIVVVVVGVSVVVDGLVTVVVGVDGLHLL